MDLTGKTAVVTGAGSGIGAGICRVLFRHGANVALIDIDESTCQKIADELPKSHGRTSVHQADVRSVEDIQNVANEVIRLWGKVDILVNNAGITMDNLLIRMTDNEWNDVIETNLSSVYRITKEFIKDMMKDRYGRVINIGSVVGMSGNAGQTNYSATKSALLGFTKSLAKEVASRNITVNTVSPGFIDTDMTKKLKDSQKDALMSSIPLGRMGSTEELAHVVQFLASDEASYITGENINVNGGLYM